MKPSSQLPLDCLSVIVSFTLLPILRKKQNVGKATLYSYFKSKDEIYMESLVLNFTKWHEGLRIYIQTQNTSSDELITYLCRSITDFTLFVDLVSLASVVLEENLETSFLVKARARMRDQSRLSCQVLAQYYKCWSEEEVKRNLRRFYLYGVALWKECFPSPQVALALPPKYSIRALQRERFFTELHSMSQLIWSLKPS